MTDGTLDTVAVEPSVHTSDEAHRRLARRYASERRFRYLGLGAVLVACAFLVLLLSTVVGKGISAFTYHYVTLPLDLTGDNINAENPRRSNFSAIIRSAVDGALPFVEGRTPKRAARGLLSGSSDVLLSRAAADDADFVGQSRSVGLPLSDTVDLYLKGLVAPKSRVATAGEAIPSGTSDDIQISAPSGSFASVLQRAKEALVAQADTLDRQTGFIQRGLTAAEDRLAAERERLATAANPAEIEERIAEINAEIASLKGRIENQQKAAADLRGRAAADDGREGLGSDDPSYFVHINGGVVKVNEVARNAVAGTVLVPLRSEAPAADGGWSIELIDLPESSRKVSDREIAYIDYLSEQGMIDRRLNSLFFTSGASREPEMAGIMGAVLGSLFTMLVTLMMSFPLGVAAAIYLEEFAPKNRWTHLIEVNINNLAAVPSIVFGLLGLAVFLNFFGLPRSAPLVGGMVLALMTLPTIIIASRAALKAVPPSIREAALGVGASHIQAVFHHVLPLAMPGIMTGTIIGMAQALGETAPLLMIGMVAFIVDIPAGFLDPATVLPVQIYMWADFPEQAFQQKTAAAILVLLAFLVLMNAVAVLMRKRFERRW
jgi:phosphate transport system permease protein